MNCPNCGYFNDVGIQAAVKINDKDGHPINPPTRYDCRRCGHIYNSDDATRWRESGAPQSLYDSVLDLMRLVDVHNMFTISPVTRDGGQEMVKIEVKGWDGTAFIISSIAQIDSVVALSQAWLTQRAGEKS